MDTHTITTKDGFDLTATQFTPETPNNQVILISAASGVRQHYYFNFAIFLSEHGFTVYTYDYRGIGLSLDRSVRKTHATYQIWATQDYEAMVDYIAQQHPGKSYALVGHSFGGNGAGMTLATNKFNKIVTVAAALTYWRYAARHKQWLILLNAYVFAPVTSWVLGYFPAKAKGLGENLPYGVAQQWRRGLTDPDSIVAIAHPEHNHYSEITTKMLMISIEDDWISTAAGVDALAAHYQNAEVERRHIRLEETRHDKIGHIDFFRKRFADDLWQIPLAWLTQA
ncbi:putative alpha/beta hydrolase [Alteromonadaceae bacterium 2753L.S.0a.02]|nr:putative alpha/beta hydrolase [Alteromonadaceae bacterium 2753L.S.0a.02]